MPPNDPNINATGLANRTSGNIDRTIISLSGASQSLMIANPIRKRILIKNGDTNAGVNLNGGVAAIGGVGTITLQPYEGLALVGDDCPKGLITVIGTAAKYLSAEEGV